MTKTRLESFSDGILGTIMMVIILEIDVPQEATWAALYNLVPVLLCYLMSFVFVGIYWGNHHHLLYTIHQVNSKIIWSNMALLFFLSLIPFSTAWMGENRFSKIPVAIYAINLLLSSIAFYILQKIIMTHHKNNAQLTGVFKKQEKKGIASLILYSLSIPCAFFYPIISALMFVSIALMWLVPNKEIEQASEKQK